MTRCLRSLALLLLVAASGTRAQPAAVSAPASASGSISASASTSASASAVALVAPAAPAVTSPTPVSAAIKALVDDSRAAMRTDPDRSRRLAEQALAELDQIPDPDLQVIAHFVLCDYHAERDRNAAQRHLEAAQALLPRVTRPALAAQVLGCEGDLKELAGESARATELYERAVSIAQDAHDDEVLANALYQRGYLRGVRGELANGLGDLRRANDIFERIHLPEQALNTLLAVATLYDRMGDHAQARRYYEDALNAQRSAGLTREQAVTQHNLGRALENMGDWPAAQASFEKALDLSRQIAFPRGEAYALRGLASVSNATGRGDSALSYLERANALLTKAPDERLRAQIALQRGIALRLTGRPTDAMASLTESLKVFEAADSQAESITARGELATTYAAVGDYKSAFEQGNRYKAASDKLLLRQIEERFATLKIEFATAVTDRENQLLKREKVATERALAQEQRASGLRAVALLLAAMLVAVLSVLVVRHRRASSRMHGLAMTDELTQLSNRRHVLNTLQAAIAHGATGAVLIADLDLFKAVNDRHGHLVGDEILRTVAAALRSAVPADAELGRLGGEEFVVVLRTADREAALAIAERARQAVAAIDASRWLPDRGVTISIGVTQITPHDELSAVLRRADEALFEAKGAGRNCVRCSPDREPMPFAVEAEPSGSLDPRVRISPLAARS